MLALFVRLSCFLLFVAGSKELFLADMTCRYHAHNLSHKRWDSEPLRLKEYRRAFTACTMEIFQPHSVECLASLFNGATEEGREVYGELMAWYTVIAPQNPILRVFACGCVPDEPISCVVKPHSVIVCNKSNKSTFPREELDGVFDEVLFLHYIKSEPDVTRIAERMGAFQQRAVPGVTVEDLIAFYHRGLPRCPSVLLESTLPKAAGTVELCLDKDITDYSPKALGADFVTEFGLLYHLNRSSSFVDNNEKMLEGLRLFFPQLRVTSTMSYMPDLNANLFTVPWAPPFHPIRPHRPQLMYHRDVNHPPGGLWFPITGNYHGISIPDYSKQKFFMCNLGQTKISPHGMLFAMFARATMKNPPNTSDRRLLIAHLLRTKYSSDISDPTTKRRYDSIDWYFDAHNANKYWRLKREAGAAIGPSPVAR